MASLISGGLQNALIQFTETPQAGFLSGNNIALTPTRVQAAFTAGTAIDQIDGLSAQILTFVASTPQTIDLTALTDVVTGAALTVARIRFLAFKALSQADAAVLLVGDAITNEFDGFLSAAATMKVFPSTAKNDGFTIITAPNVSGMVVSSTSKALKLDPGANAMQVILIVGTASV